MTEFEKLLERDLRPKCVRFAPATCSSESGSGGAGRAADTRKNQNETDHYCGARSGGGSHAGQRVGGAAKRRRLSRLCGRVS
jgi:hypothetical protein